MNKKQVFNYVTAAPLAMEYNFHLDDEVTGTEDYRELFEVLRMANDMDIVRISIQNFGGTLHTCISIVSAIRSSKALVIGSLTSIAYSAASIIWLACDYQEVFEHASFMAHDGAGWSSGSFTQQYKQIEHSKKVLEGLYRDVYEGFLSDDEIDNILEGSELWLDFEEIVDRLNGMAPEQEEADPLTPEELSKLTKKELVKIIIDNQGKQATT